MSAKAINQFS